MAELLAVMPSPWLFLMGLIVGYVGGFLFEHIREHFFEERRQ